MCYHVCRLAAEATLHEREAWRKTYRETISMTNLQMLLTEIHRDILIYRYDMINQQMNDEKLRARKIKLEVNNEYLEHILQIQLDYQYSTQQQIISQEQKIESSDISPDIIQRHRNQLKALQKLMENRQAFLASLLATSKISTQVLEEVELRLLQEKLSNSYHAFLFLIS
jgi:hypothetical protein